MAFETKYEDSGTYKVGLAVSDGTGNAVKEWNVEVKDVDLNALLSGIKDVELLETETAISEPIGDDNKWETDYGDSGEYTVSVEAEGNGFSGEKEVKIVVKNKDRKPEITALKDLTVNENEEVR